MANTAFDHASALTIPGSTTNNGLVRWGDTSGTSFGNITGITSDGSNLTLLTRGEIRFSDADSTHFIALESPATVGTSYTMTLPAAVPSAADYLKVTSYSGGAGVLEWASVSADTNTTYTTSWVDSSNDAILRLTPSSGSADDLTLVAGTNITLTPSGDNLTITAASGGGVVSGDTDNAVLRADGTGGSTSQGSTVIINDSGDIGIVDGCATIPGIYFKDDTDTGFMRAGANRIGIVTGGAKQFEFNCRIFMANEAVNGNMSYGVTLNQGGADNEILAFKSSDVAHGVTGTTETDTFSFFKKYIACAGGVQMWGMSESTLAIQFHGIGTGEVTGKTTGSPGTIDLRAGKANGTAIASLGSDGNLVTINDHGVGIRFIFDVEGTMHADVGSTTYDDECDVELLRGFLATTCDQYKQNYTERFNQELMYNQQWYEDNKLIGKCSIHYETRECGRVQQRAMVNFTGLTMLHHSTIIQMNDQLTARIDGLETQLKALSEGK